MATIHPTAIVDPGAIIGEDVEIGPYAIVEADTEIGTGSVLRPHSVIRRYTSLGSGNRVDSFVALGGEPQDVKFDHNSRTYLRIGDNNVFREGVTISRATGEGLATTVGNGTYWMANTHAAHNCDIHDQVILVNGSVLAGHVTLERGALLGGYSSVHQFTWIGEKVMMQASSNAGMHIPPFVICSQDNNVVCLNSIGLRRAEDISPTDIKDIKEAFRITYRSGKSPADALEAMEECTHWGPQAIRFRDFVRRAIQAEKPFARGLCGSHNRVKTRRGK